MKRIYRAANIIEAQLLLDDLKSAGIEAHMSGGYLSGAIGELPPHAVISVWITADQHFTRAREVTAAFDRATSEHYADRDCRSCGETNAGSFSQCWKCGVLFPADP